jgi:virginiamycin B lyase
VVRTAAVLVGMLAVTAPASAVSADAGLAEYGPLPSSLPIGGVCETQFDATGTLWVEQYLSSQVARYDLSTGRFTEYRTPMPLSVPGGMAVGPDGGLWMPEVTGNALLRVDPGDGSMREYRLPWRNAFDTTVAGLPLLFGIIKPGPGNTIVMDVPQQNEVVTLDVHTYRFTRYPLPTPSSSFPVGVWTARDGSIWVTESLGMKIARIDPASGAVQEFPLFGAAGVLTTVEGARFDRYPATAAGTDHAGQRREPVLHAVLPDRARARQPARHDQPGDTSGEGVADTVVGLVPV